MSEDIIRSSKEHEVAIPEGSINAKSKSGMVNMTAIEPEHREKAVQDNTVTNRRIAIDDDQEPDVSAVTLPAQDSHGENHAHLATEAHQDHAVALATDSFTPSAAVPLATEAGAHDHHVLLPDTTSDLHDPNLVPTLTTEAHPGDLLDESAEASQDGAELKDPTSQVVASLADKWSEEYEGRVVKLREEVELLNQRLDHLEK